jgi:outer membrane protein W
MPDEGNVVFKKALIGTLLLFLVCGAALAEVKGHKFRGRIIDVIPTGDFEFSEDTGEYPSTQIGRIDVFVEPDDAIGLEVGWEILFSDRMGLGLTLGVTNHDADLELCTMFGDYVINADLTYMPLTASLLFHVTPEAEVDFYIGPSLAFVFYGKYEFDDTIAGEDFEEDLDTDNDLGFGVEMGLDVPIGEEGWFFTSNVKYLSTTAEVEDIEIDIDPWTIGLGFGYSF